MYIYLVMGSEIGYRNLGDVIMHHTNPNNCNIMIEKP